MRLRSSLVLIAIGAAALSGCTTEPPSSDSADRAGARVGQLTAALAGFTQGYWQRGLAIETARCELDDGSQGVSWAVNGLQPESSYPFTEGDETADEIGDDIGEFLSEFGYDVEVAVEMRPGDQEEIVITGHTADPDDELIEFRYTLYPFDQVSTLIHIRTECLEGDRDNYPAP